MPKLEEAASILSAIDMPAEQHSDICCYTLLAMAAVQEKTKWINATNPWIRIHDIMQFLKHSYHKEYAENSRETIRKQALHHFRNAAIVEDNNKATNSPNYMYRLTDEFLTLIKTYKSKGWETSLSEFKSTHTSLQNLYASKRQVKKMPLLINNKEFVFSTGKHNELQKAVLEDFAPRFAPNSECLYIGDTTKKDLYKDINKLSELGFSITLHDKMPDVVLYRQDKNWLYFIEAVTSVGPMDSKRMLELSEMTKNVKSGKIFVTAFLDFKTYKQFSDSLAWETEVWIAKNPDHMIHLNGDKFVGPR